jgi:hypothetical protein
MVLRTVKSGGGLAMGGLGMGGLAMGGLAVGGLAVGGLARDGVGVVLVDGGRATLGDLMQTYAVAAAGVEAVVVDV